MIEDSKPRSAGRRVGARQICKHHFSLIYMKKITSFIFVSFLLIICNAQKAKKDSLFNAQVVLNLMHKVADWQLSAWDTSTWRRAQYDWTHAAGYAGVMELAKISPNDKYVKFLIKTGNDLNWNTGRRRFHADDYCIAQTYCNLYLINKDEKMIAAFRQLADSIVAQPHTESLEWKNSIAQREWAWCDALFMGPPPLSYLTTATGDQKYLNTAARLWWQTTDYLYDSSEHLYFRDQTFFDKKEKNGQKVFWSRGNGWVLAGLVRVLENMPAKHPERKKFISLYKEMAARIAGLQHADGSWHASLLDPESYPIKETSGTAFFAYSLLWGINHKIIKKKTYWPVVEKAWRALATSVHPKGMLGYVQPVGAAPGKSDINSTEPYGVGAFLLTGSELYKFLK